MDEPRVEEKLVGLLFVLKGEAAKNVPAEQRQADWDKWKEDVRMSGNQKGFIKIMSPGGWGGRRSSQDGVCVLETLPRDG